MNDFCKANNFTLVSIETYEEDLGLYSAFGGFEGKIDTFIIVIKRVSNREIDIYKKIAALWIGAIDVAREGTWVWYSTGKPLSPGYQGWAPNEPGNTCTSFDEDCAVYAPGSGGPPKWADVDCTSLRGGGICELQPSNSPITIELQ